MNTTTIPLRSIMSPGTRLLAPGPHCWNRNHLGWIAATAPWGDEEPQEWLQRHAPQLLYSSRGGPNAHPQDMLLRVFDLGGRLSEHDRLLVGAFTTNQTEAFTSWSWYFLCTLPGVRHVIADLAPLLNHHPEELRSPPKPPCRLSKRKPRARLSAVR